MNRNASVSAIQYQITSLRKLYSNNNIFFISYNRFTELEKECICRTMSLKEYLLQISKYMNDKMPINYILIDLENVQPKKLVVNGKDVF